MYTLTDTHGSSLRIGYHQAVFHLTTHQTELSFVTLVIFGRAYRFKGDSFPLASTLSEQLFHRQVLLLAATPVAISLWGKTEPYQHTSLFVASDSV